MKKIRTIELVTGSILLAMGILFPMIFHAFGMAGAIFLPMHIPVLIGGYLLAPELAFLLGVLTPILSSLLTGMPVFFPISIIMMFELSFYGLVVSIFTRKYKQNILISLPVAMVIGRIIAALSVLLLIFVFGIKMNPYLYIKGAVITGMPGILIQIIVIPPIIRAIKISKFSLADNK